MATLRELYEEALMEKKNPKGSKGMAGLVGYNNALRKGGQWKGNRLSLTSKPPGKKVGLKSPNPYHDALGRFTNLGKTKSQSPKSVSFGKGGERWMVRGKGKSIKATSSTAAGSAAGRDSGSGREFKTNQTKGFQATAFAKGPSPDRVLARTGKTKEASGNAGIKHISRAERIAHLANLVGDERAATILAKKASKGRARKGGGRRGRAARAESYDANSLFFNRLVEGLV